MERFFLYSKVLEREKVPLVAIYFKGLASEWYYHVKCLGLMLPWETFKNALRDEFILTPVEEMLFNKLCTIWMVLCEFSTPPGPASRSTTACLQVYHSLPLIQLPQPATSNQPTTQGKMLNDLKEGWCFDCGGHWFRGHREKCPMRHVGVPLKRKLSMHHFQEDNQVETDNI
ncbi:hypothetical protein SELMODRAFT_404856 [Selaginella moellendorffii]|uniref:Retrotransposon gag domain-containing protein n=1 Tax=Selaginella moellendorffii TaxID=88036 RepID=D8QXK6_SELML|nr:hypothetical protein SELMODRAFT_404856 [Selaginella moellendorffii]